MSSLENVWYAPIRTVAKQGNPTGPGLLANGTALMRIFGIHERFQKSVLGQRRTGETIIEIEQEAAQALLGSGNIEDWVPGGSSWEQDRTDELGEVICNDPYWRHRWAAAAYKVLSGEGPLGKELRKKRLDPEDFLEHLQLIGEDAMTFGPGGGWVAGQAALDAGPEGVWELVENILILRETTGSMEDVDLDARYCLQIICESPSLSQALALGADKERLKALIGSTSRDMRELGIKIASRCAQASRKPEAGVKVCFNKPS